MKKIVIYFFIFVTGILYSEDLSGTYILDYDNQWDFELLTLKKIGTNYLSLYDVPTASGRKSYSAYEIGKWDGEQIIFENIDTIYAIKPLSDGTLYYYAIKDPDEFPGKDFRELTEVDLKKITDSKSP